MSPQNTQGKPKLKLVFSGGGAKGVAYVGAYAALSDAQVLEQVEEVSGISAGSIMATCVAIGMDPSTVRKKLFSEDLQSLLGNKSKTKSNHTIRGFSKTGKPLSDFVNRVIQEHLQSYFKNLEKYAHDDDLISLKTRWEQSNNNYELTFADLEILRKNNPKKFKRLFIAGCNKKKELIAYNWQQNANATIASACRSSASLPVILEPHTNNDGTMEFDGGLKTNFLTEHFTPPEDPNNSQTIIFAFSTVSKNLKELDSTQAVIHKTQWRENIINDEQITAILTDALSSFSSISNTNNIAGHWHNCLKIASEKSSAVKPKYIAKLIHLTRTDDLFMSELKALLMSIKNHQQFRTTNTTKPKNSKDVLSLYKSWLEKNYKNQFKLDLKHRITDKLLRAFNITGQSLAETKREDKSKLHKQPLNVVSLQIGKLNTTNFRKAAINKVELEQTAYVNTLTYLYNFQLTEDERLKQVPKILDKVLPAFFLSAQDKEWLKSVRGQKTNNHSSINSDLNQYQDLNKYRSIYSNKPIAKALTLVEQYIRKQIDQLEFMEQLYINSFSRDHYFARSQFLGKTFFFTCSLKKYLQSMDPEAKRQLFLEKLHENSDKTTRIRKVAKIVRELSEEINTEQEQPKLPSSS